MQRSANAEDVTSLTSAIGLLHKLPDNTGRDRHELLLELALAIALTPLKGFSAPEVARAFTRARELCERLGEPPELFPVLRGLFGVYFTRGEFRRAYELAEELMHRAESKNDPALLLSAHLALGYPSFNMGKLLQARVHLESVISRYDPRRDGPSAVRHSVDAKTNALSYMALTLWSLGYPDQALKRAYEAVEFAQALPHLHSLASAQGILGEVQLARRETRVAQETAERLLTFCAEHGFTHWSAFATFHRGWSLTEQGRHEEGIPLMEEGIAAHRATGARIGHPFFLCTLSEAYMQAGRLGEGLSTLSEALALADEQEGRQYEAEIYRVKGELLLRQDDSNVGEAQRCFERAIEVARSQSAKSHELRATTSLARLLASQGRRDEARTMLTGIYNWFTAGFDTVDLKDAKALLEELTG